MPTCFFGAKRRLYLGSSSPFDNTHEFVCACVLDVAAVMRTNTSAGTSNSNSDSDGAHLRSGVAPGGFMGRQADSSDSKGHVEGGFIVNNAKRNANPNANANANGSPGIGNSHASAHKTPPPRYVLALQCRVLLVGFAFCFGIVLAVILTNTI